MAAFPPLAADCGQLIEQLMGEIMNYDAEYRREDATGPSGSHARH
jgi:hypothetical protein